MIAIAGCRMKRNVIGPVGPIKNVAPKTAETFCGHPVPSHPEGEESNHEQRVRSRLTGFALFDGASVKARTLRIDSIRLSEAQHLCGRIAPMLTVDR